MKVCWDVRLALIVSTLIVGTANLDAGESFFFGEKEDWSNVGLVTNEDGSLGLKGGQWTYSAETFPVDTTATSKLRGEFKKLPSATEKDRFYFAFLTFDKDMKRIEAIHVNPVKGSDTQLAAPCTAKDTVITVNNGADFKKGAFIAFHAMDDYQDLPNRNVNAKAPITTSRQLADGTWAVTVEAPIAIDAPAGTRVRAHRGGWYQYSGALAEPLPNDWTTIEGTIQGAAPGDHRHRWRPGTAYAQLILFGGGSTKEPFLAFRNVRLESTDGTEDGSFPRSVVTIPAGTVETHFPLRPVKGGQDLKVHFANGSSRTVRVTVFDEKITDRKHDVILPAAGVEIRPFDVRYTLRPSAFPAGNVSPAERIKQWGKEEDLYGKAFVLSLRQLDNAVEFRVNGSYIGTMKRASRAASVTSGMKIENVSFHGEPFSAAFVPIDISPRCKPGAMEGARIRLTDKAVPFITADGKNLDMGVTAKQSSLGGGQVSLAETPASFIFTVPCEQYTRAWVLCAVEDDPRKDPVLNARLTRYVGGAGFQGRAWEGMANTSLALPGSAVRVGEVTVSGKPIRRRPRSSRSRWLRSTLAGTGSTSNCSTEAACF